MLRRRSGGILARNLETFQEQDIGCQTRRTSFCFPSWPEYSLVAQLICTSTFRHAPNEDSLDFTNGAHNITRLYEIVNDVGIYVTSRPGVRHSWN